MAVNLAAPSPGSLHPVRGVELGVAMAGIKKPGRKDLLVMRLHAGATVAGCLRRTASALPRSCWQENISFKRQKSEL